MSRAVLSLNESSRELIAEVAGALEPYFPDLTAAWRDRVQRELQFDWRAIVGLERLGLATGCPYFAHGDFEGFFENAAYFGRRLAKLKIDTRAVARSLELFKELSDPYLSALFGERQSEARAALDMLSSAVFVTVAGSYFDAQSMESTALLSLLDAELKARDVPSLLQQALEITIKTFGACVGRLRLRDEAGQLAIAASYGLPEDPDGVVAIGEGFSGRIAASGEAELIFNPAQSEHVMDPSLKAAAKTLWGVPLKANGEVIGVMLIGFMKPYEWLPSERELLRALADRSALAIDRARMTDALREREARIAELSAHLLMAQEDERKHISRELHDDTGQALMVIRLYLDMLQDQVASRSARDKIAETVAVVDRTIEGIRRTIARLSPLVLQELGLIAALRKLGKDLSKDTGIKTRVVVPDSVGRLAPEAEIAIYRVVQEALHNVAKHSHAQSVTIQIGRENDLVRVLVEDNGVGMNTGKLHVRGHSFGVAGIKERVGMLGGTVHLTSVKGKGTRLEFTVPGRTLAPPLKAVTRAAVHSQGPVYRVN